MPTLLPRRSAGRASIIRLPAQRPPFTDTRSATALKFTRLRLGSLTFQPVSLPFRNLRPLITQAPLLRTTKAYGQFLGRDFNPLVISLLLRTSVPFFPSSHETGRSQKRDAFCITKRKIYNSNSL